MKFSLLTAIKDGFFDFKKTVPTVLNQTWKEFEWIIVDDGSASDLVNVFPELKLDPRVKIIKQDFAGGQTAALNVGIRNARGEWIVRADADDLYHLDRLKIIAAELENNKSVCLFFSDYEVIDEANLQWALVQYRTPIDRNFLSYLEKKNNPICHPTAAFRKLKNNGSLWLYREDLHNAQDYALWKEIVAESGFSSLAHIPIATVRYRVSRNSLSGARAPEQKLELSAVRKNKVLSSTSRADLQLNEKQKEAMQSYRLMYYRLVGHAKGVPGLGDLGLLISASGTLNIFLKSMLFFIARPIRKIFLYAFFRGIYK